MTIPAVRRGTPDGFGIGLEQGIAPMVAHASSYVQQPEPRFSPDEGEAGGQKN